jgi:succinyl-diaminopimelate desuccinylase
MNYEFSLLKKLVAINTDSTTKSNYAKCASLIEKECRKLGLKTKTISPKAPDGKPRSNVIAELNADAKETLVLNAHYDVVPAGNGWKTDPFKMVVKNKTAFGRGVADDKSGIAAVLAAAKELAARKSSKVNLKMVFSCDEEVGSEYGLEYLCRKMRKEIAGDCALVLDGSFKHLDIASCFVAQGRIVLKGHQGHAGYPHKVKNILHAAIPFLADLKKYAKIRELVQSKKLNAPPGCPHKKVWGRFNITMLHAGVKENVLPPELAVGFDLRILPDENPKKAWKDFVRYVERLLKKHKLKAKKLSLSQPIHPGYFISEKEEIVKKVCGAFRKVVGKEIPVASSLGGTDGAAFAHAKIPAVVFMCGGKGVHGANESISLKNIELSKKILIQLCENW